MKVFATLFDVSLEADVASDGRFELRGLPSDARVTVTASTATPNHPGREARAEAKAGDLSVSLTLSPLLMPR